jgi:hypothetical protein
MHAELALRCPAQGPAGAGSTYSPLAEPPKAAQTDQALQQAACAQDGLIAVPWQRCTSRRVAHSSAVRSGALGSWLTMEDTSQVLDVLDNIISSVDNPVTLNVSDSARAGLERIRGALEVKDLDSLLAAGRHDPLSVPPMGLQEEDLKYFNLYRESYSVEPMPLPAGQRHANGAKASHGCALPLPVHEQLRHASVQSAAHLMFRHLAASLAVTSANDHSKATDFCWRPSHAIESGVG